MITEIASGYPEPVAALLALGQPSPANDRGNWLDYRAGGLTEAHVPDLRRLSEDPRLDDLEEDDPAVWALYHACRAIGQVGSAADVPWLLKLDEVYPLDDWLLEEVMHSVTAIGPSAIPAVAAHLADKSLDALERGTGADLLHMIGKAWPEHRGECISILHSQLTAHTTNSRFLNGMLVSALVNLRETDAMPLIREAFAHGNVDIGMVGDVEDVEIAMGLRLVRETPKPDYFADFDEDEMLAELMPERDLPAAGGFPGIGASGADDGFLPPLSGFPAGETAENPYRDVGRNDPCPCGSGKKFKKCCLPIVRG